MKKIKKITNEKSPNLCYRERLKISCLPTLYIISETVYIDRTTSALRQSLFLWWSRAAVVYLYVCMREDHLYIELIEQEKPTNPHKKKIKLMLLCWPSRTVKRTSDKVEDDCRGEASIHLLISLSVKRCLVVERENRALRPLSVST